MLRARLKYPDIDGRSGFKITRASICICLQMLVEKIAVVLKLYCNLVCNICRYCYYDFTMRGELDTPK